MFHHMVTYQLSMIIKQLEFILSCRLIRCKMAKWNHRLTSAFNKKAVVPKKINQNENC